MLYYIVNHVCSRCLTACLLGNYELHVLDIATLQQAVAPSLPTSFSPSANPPTLTPTPTPLPVHAQDRYVQRLWTAVKEY